MPAAPAYPLDILEIEKLVQIPVNSAIGPLREASNFPPGKSEFASVACPSSAHLVEDRQKFEARPGDLAQRLSEYAR